MKKYYIKKWPWWKFWLKDIMRISKNNWDGFGGTIQRGIVDEYGDLKIMIDTPLGWWIPKGYFKEVKND